MIASGITQSPLPELRELCLSCGGGYVGGIDSRGKPQVLDVSRNTLQPLPLPTIRRGLRKVRVTKIRFAEPASTVVFGDANGRVWTLSLNTYTYRIIAGFKAVDFHTLPGNRLLLWTRTPSVFTKKDLKSGAKARLVLYDLSSCTTVFHRVFPFRINFASVSPKGDLAIVSDGYVGKLVDLRNSLQPLLDTTHHRFALWRGPRSVLFRDAVWLKEFNGTGDGVCKIFTERESIIRLAQAGYLFAYTTFDGAIHVWKGSPDDVVRVINPPTGNKPPPTWLGFVSMHFIAAEIGSRIFIWALSSGDVVYAGESELCPLHVATGAKIIVRCDSKPTLLTLPQEV